MTDRSPHGRGNARDVADETLDAELESYSAERQPRGVAGSAKRGDGQSLLQPPAVQPLIPDDVHVARHIRLVEGSDVELSSETNTLLRGRLRIAALLLCAVFSTILMWRLFLTQWKEGAIVMVATHFSVTLILGIMGLSLCRTCALSTNFLRLKELLVFGVPAIFFLFWEYEYVREQTVLYGIMPNIAAAWMLLIFTYALFIPNTWQRSGMVIGTLAAAPIVLINFLALYDKICSVVEGAASFAVLQSLVIAATAMISIVGVATIRALRREAFEAKQLGRYRLRHSLGKGGMGDVYLAEHQMMKRPCAIKVIRAEKADDPKALARFEREVELTSQLSHWNSIDIYDYGQADDGTFYYVMEYLPGMNLQELVNQYGPLPPERACSLLFQTCQALKEAHEVGLVHRDIKPANIFAAQRGGVYDVAKLLDFGLVKPMAAEMTDDLTGDFAITGSPLYMAPEQASGEREPDVRSDVYSIGVVAYSLLAGKPPFSGGNPVQVIIAHSAEEPVSLCELDSTIPTDLNEVVMRCLRKRPDDRFQSVSELANALRSCECADRWTDERARNWWLENEPQRAADIPLHPNETLSAPSS